MIGTKSNWTTSALTFADLARTIEEMKGLPPLKFRAREGWDGHLREQLRKIIRPAGERFGYNVSTFVTEPPIKIVPAAPYRWMVETSTEFFFFLDDDQFVVVDKAQLIGTGIWWIPTGGER